MPTDTTAKTLKQRISEFTTEMAKSAPPEVVKTLGAEITKLAETGIAGKALKVGAPAPQFSLPSATGGAVRLSALTAKGHAVVTFYRGGWCPFCDLQLRAYQEVLPEIQKLGAELVAISPQTPDYSLSDVQKKGLKFSVLSDAGNKVAKSYGLVFVLSDVMQGLQKAFNNPIPKFNGDQSWELPMPGTFVVDKRGLVRLAHVDPNYMTRLEPSAILETLRKLQA